MLNKLKEVVDSVFGKLTDPEQIAQLCRERQIQGFTYNSASCPMAKLVREQVDFPVGFAMGKKIGTGVWFINNHEKPSIPAPVICDNFVNQFDAGYYKDLIAWREDENLI